MLKATFFVGNQIYQNNRIFDEKSFLNRDDTLRCHIQLKKKLEKININLSTQDINNEGKSLFVLYFDFIPKEIKNINSYLILFESKLIKPENWIYSKHKKFKKVFTWDDSLLKDKLYIKINFSQDLNILFDNEKRDKHLVQISANKLVNQHNELYTERRKIINWHEQNTIPFDFYGYNWHLYISGNRYLDYITNKVGFRKKYKNYKGSIKSKYDILKNYKFSYCLENFHGQEGYITEKIFDCFKTLTIPIYKGDKSVINHIPQEVFINYDNFESLLDLNNFLLKMRESKFSQYQKNIKEFLYSPDAEKFSANYFVDQIIKNIKFV